MSQYEKRNIFKFSQNPLLDPLPKPYSVISLKELKPDDYHWTIRVRLVAKSNLFWTQKDQTELFYLADWMDETGWCRSSFFGKAWYSEIEIGKVYILHGGKVKESRIPDSLPCELKFDRNSIIKPSDNPHIPFDWLSHISIASALQVDSAMTVTVYGIVQSILRREESYVSERLTTYVFTIRDYSTEATLDLVVPCDGTVDNSLVKVNMVVRAWHFQVADCKAQLKIGLLGKLDIEIVDDIADDLYQWWTNQL